MSRILFFALLVLNLLALAGLSGWLGERAPAGEPERLTNQLRPEVIRPLDPAVLAESLRAATVAAAELATAPAEPPPAVAPPEEPAPAAPVEAPPAPVAPPPPQACFRFQGLSDAQAARLAEVVAPQGERISVSEDVELVPTSWWVHVPPQPSRRAAEAKVGEIRALGVKDLFILLDEGPFQYAISLGLFKTESSAKLHLSRMKARGVNSGVITARGNRVHRVELRGDADLLEQLRGDAEPELEDIVPTDCEA